MMQQDSTGFICYVILAKVMSSSWSNDLEQSLSVAELPLFFPRAGNQIRLLSGSAIAALNNLKRL